MMDGILFTLLYFSVTILIFILMEGVAWFLHKYVMHGFAWFLHEDHHRYTGKSFQKNDVFGLFFAIVSFLFILTGILSCFDIKFAIGIGIMLYGLGYFLIHEIFFHRRIKVGYHPSGKYMQWFSKHTPFIIRKALHTVESILVSFMQIKEQFWSNIIFVP